MNNLFRTVCGQSDARELKIPPGFEGLLNVSNLKHIQSFKTNKFFISKYLCNFHQNQRTYLLKVGNDQINFSIYGT